MALLSWKEPSPYSSGPWRTAYSATNLLSFLVPLFFRAASGPESDSGDHSDWNCKYECFLTLGTLWLSQFGGT